MTREEWLKERQKGIGGSDAATVWGLNKYKTNIRLWEEKTGRRQAEDISDKPFVKYGTDMEPILRQSFQIKNPQFEVMHNENSIIKHPEYPFLFASLDGVLMDKETGEMGILEIKTSDVNRSRHYEDWKERVPDNYYLQCLHYMNVTGYSFVVLFAELKISNDYRQKTYTINRSDEGIEETIEELQKREIDFWTQYVEKNVCPPLKIPEI